MLTDLLGYLLRIAPGLTLVTGCLLLTRRQRDPLLSIVLLILGFVLIRDAMTPLGLWRLGTVGGLAPWLRFSTDTALLAALGVATLALTATVLAGDRRLRALVPRQRPDLAGVGLGIAGAALAAGPVLAIASHWPPVDRGGTVAHSAIPVILFFCLAGNLFEEVLFRGLLQSRLAQLTSPVRAALLSGLFFGACHSFLASTVTDLGWPLLAFTAWEGLVCAFLRLRHGLTPAVLAHGLAIAALATGLPW
ncbi:CPBP family intramembrane glutamic endopeptidase [Plantactinospora sp. BB1]|uniref:CPBP family intramembrane glutamic endopeptidase n=1 Tax=Plantactinospora sp. BB1 TaxID=2071627 RepID=UPI000D179B15|nr:CPBP family intramembrane glutamic endopeptidase [Plantactinospora sp. BB1]AVT41539.1 CPBP family intramembrane metalloprotease [Plantactinospora sp. BB1]